MIHRIEAALRRMRRAMSRDEWSWRLLRLPPPAPHDGRRGLLLIQIDGLSAHQLDKALKRGRMPFVRSLLQREGYRRHSLYSGIPSTTPAAQGELFYGRPCCVPAFAYRAKRDGQVMTLLNAESAERIETSLREAGESLLAGGSAYSNIYTGGADEPHFCASRLSARKLWESSHPLAVAAVLVWNFPSVLRLLGLLGVEAVLALYDALRGRLARRDLYHEFVFLFSRVLVCVGLREVVTAMASMDLARGLPVVQLNFPGYDEQAHRRGPSSAFAHFSLRGIDQCVRRLYHAAHRSVHRDYEVWLYSDHGQEDAVPYTRIKGRTLQEAVREALAGTAVTASQNTPPSAGKAARPGERIVRSQDPVGARLEGSLWPWSERSRQDMAPMPSDPSSHRPREPEVLAYGPLGHVYLPTPCLPALRDRMAATLQRQADIPMVLYASAPGEARAFTPAGTFLLPQEAEAVLGAHHPFAHAVARDLVKVCHHPDAGDFVVAGWLPRRSGAHSRQAAGATGRSVTFAWENGAHGGPGREETHAFALLPGSVSVGQPPDGHPFRHADLRALALGLRHARKPAFPRPQPGDALVFVTYNVHACGGMDGKISAPRIARVLAQTRGRIFCLQECYGPERGDLTAQIMEHLRNEYHFENLSALQDPYGNAIVTDLPLRAVRQAALPTVEGFTLEERGAQWAEITWRGLPLQVFNTHLGLLARERLRQAEALTGEGWLPEALAKGPVLFAGDFNAGARSAPFRLIERHLLDAQESLQGHRPRNTFFGSLPVHRIDHVFLSRDLRVLDIEVRRSHLTRLASDHLPVIVTFDAR